MRSSTSLCLMIVLSGAMVGTIPSGAAAQAPVDRVQYRTIGTAEVSVPGVTPFDVGLFGGGLAEMERRNPEIAPLASRFRVQRRTGLLLSVVAVTGAAIGIGRMLDANRGVMEITDPQAGALIGGIAAFALSGVQLNAAAHTLNEIAAELPGPRR